MSKRHFHLTIIPEGKVLNIPEGTNLLSALQKAGIQLTASCGGQGTCGTCKIIIESGKYNTGATPFLNKKEIKEGYVLACLTLVEGDISITIPPSSKILGKRIIYGGPEQLINDRWAIGDWNINPRSVGYYLELPPPSLSDNRSDLDRICSALSAQGCETYHLHCSLTILKDIARKLRDAEWKVTVTVMPTCDGIEIIDIQPGQATLHYCGVAIDVGTTTIVCYLVDLRDGRILSTEADYNPQITCGEDIISRIIYAQSDDGLQKLHNLVVSAINKLILQVTKNMEISTESIYSITAVGNTTMIHLLLGLTPKYIRQDPYIPTISTIPHYLKASEIGITVAKNASISGLPAISSYVGSDISAGILAIGMYKLSELCVFVDIGTNGEIVVGNKEWMVAASCSAGPAFEGGEVKFGMRASSGAVDALKIDPKSLEPSYTTIHNQTPRGICGSGILDCLAELFLARVVDRRGKFNKELNHPRIRQGDDGWEFVIAWSKETGIGKDICLTEIDIDNIIRAKGAVYAAIRVLLKELGFTIDQVNTFLIAGGFGHCLNIENAINIGLLPDLPFDRFRYLGNSAIVGAYLALISDDLKGEINKAAKGITYIELSTSASFMDEYVSAIFLPHTIQELFPSVNEKIQTSCRECT